jgi:peptidoglycan/LPS O-acetylase OafA/YrhL
MSSMQPALGQVKLDALTGLRYLAALTVVISHVAGNETCLDYEILHGASCVGMPLFFTLSGFLMCYNYYGDFADGRSGALWRYTVARFARIYPVYLLLLLLSFSYMGNFFHDFEKKPEETRRCLAYCGTLTQSWSHQPVFLDDHNPRTVCQSYLGVAWSVSTEVFFYATFPLVIPVLRRLTSRKTLLLAAAGIWLSYAALDLAICPRAGATAGLSTHSWERWLLYMSPYGRIGEFWIGCLVGRLFGLAAESSPGVWERRLAAIAIWSCLPAFVICIHLAMSTWLLNRLHYNVGLAPLCGLCIYCLARYPSLPQRILGSGPLVLLGESSYCLFLLHPLVQSFYNPRAHGEDELTMGYIVTFNHAAMFIVMHWLALGLYRYYELPLRTWIRRGLLPRRITAPLPAGENTLPVRRAA